MKKEAGGYYDRGEVIKLSPQQENERFMDFLLKNGVPEELVSVANISVKGQQFYFDRVQQAHYEGMEHVVFGSVVDKDTQKIVNSGTVDVLLRRYFFCRKMIYGYTEVLISYVKFLQENHGTYRLSTPQ